jgi:hypothetical protein
MAALSPKMKAALARLEDGEQPVAEIGRSTVDALMNRSLVEVDEAHKLVSLPAHKHAWAMTMHMDGCHWFASSYECRCGARAGSTNERSPSADPYSAVWMDNPEECQRCRELLAGGRAQHSFTILRPKKAPAVPRIGRAS